MNHRNAGADVRDHVAFTPESAAAFRGRLAAAGVSQSLVLSTCNRCEVFLWGGNTDLLCCREEFLREFPAARRGKVLGIRTGADALTYLFRIAAGLESMVLGEYQILGQVKDAHAASLASGHAGKELDRILRDAVSAAKRVKTELDIGAVPPSVESATFGCFRMSYFKSMTGRSPRIKRSAYWLSSIRTSSGVISSRPAICQLVE